VEIISSSLFSSFVAGETIADVDISDDDEL
jgi:hypothetical protein